MADDQSVGPGPPTYAERKYTELVSYTLKLRNLAYRETTALLKSRPRNPSEADSRATEWRRSLQEPLNDLRGLISQWQSIVPPESYEQHYVAMAQSLACSERGQQLIIEAYLEGNQAKFAMGMQERMHADELFDEAVSHYDFAALRPRTTSPAE